MASLVVVKGPNEGDHYPVAHRTLVIGRAENCPIQIVDDQVSRKHLQIRYDAEAETHLVLDMQSANGVYIDGRKVEGEIALHDGDVIEIGDSQLAYFTGEFEDRESAFAHYRQRGERSKATLDRGGE